MSHRVQLLLPLLCKPHRLIGTRGRTGTPNSTFSLRSLGSLLLVLSAHPSSPLLCLLHKRRSPWVTRIFNHPPQLTRRFGEHNATTGRDTNATGGRVFKLASPSANRTGCTGSPSRRSWWPVAVVRGRALEGRQRTKCDACRWCAGTEWARKDWESF